MTICNIAERAVDSWWLALTGSNPPETVTIQGWKSKGTGPDTSVYTPVFDLAWGQEFASPSHHLHRLEEHGLLWRLPWGLQAVYTEHPAQGQVLVKIVITTERFKFRMLKTKLTSADLDWPTVLSPYSFLRSHAFSITFFLIFNFFSRSVATAPC